MREILFRGKRADTGEWVEGYVVRPKHSNEDVIESYYFNALDELGWVAECVVSADTVCQYTGLTDVREKRVFEGDICEFSVFDCDGHDTQHKGVVVYCGSRFMLWKSKESEYYGNDGGFDLDWVVAQDDEFEVAGNIYDNPELLEGASV